MAAEAALHSPAWSVCSNHQFLPLCPLYAPLMHTRRPILRNCSYQLWCNGRFYPSWCHCYPVLPGGAAFEPTAPQWPMIALSVAGGMMRFIGFCNPAEGYGFSRALGLLPHGLCSCNRIYQHSEFLVQHFACSSALVSHSGITSSRPR